MKRRTAPKGRSNLDAYIVALVEDAIARVVFAQEAIADKEPSIALTVLRDLELDLRGALVPPLICPVCRISCQWPGQLDAHRRNVHGEEAVA